jgi:hypothetical protein
MSAIFTHDEGQVKQAAASRDRFQAARGKVHTLIAPLDTFTLAEDYHQKYNVRNHTALMKEFRAAFPNDRDFVDSTAAARVNAFLSGQATYDRVAADLGLPPEPSSRILALLKR